MKICHKVFLYSELKDSAVSVPSGLFAVSPIILVILVVSIGINLLIGSQVARSFFGEQRVDSSAVTQFTDTQPFISQPSFKQEAFDSLLEGISRWSSQESSQDRISANEEYYSYSDLPRLF